MRIARIPVFLPILAVLLALPTACLPSGSTAFIDPAELGRVVEKQTQHGTYIQYAPVSLSAPWRVVVLVHGTPSTDASGRTDARAFINRWRNEAEARGFVLVAPAFDDANFGSQDGPWGGYRSLLGRVIDADEFVHEILNEYRALLPGYDGNMYLYGHSAGGQFVSRYLMIHPNRVRRAVVSAAGSYPWPNATIGWPNGMGARTLTADWGSLQRERTFQVSTASFVAAAQTPISVVVGTADTEPLSGPGGNIGANRFERGQNWVQAMNRLAADNRRVGRLSFIPVAGAPHNSVALTPASIDALF
jgi:alpha-beta hydrolase superfamily lysophospholipase